MKNIQIVDGAINASFSIYQMHNEQFQLIFPDDCDITFESEFRQNLTEEEMNNAFDGVWERRLTKQTVHGIDGTIYYNERYEPLKSRYPLRKIDPNVSSDAFLMTTCNHENLILIQIVSRTVDESDLPIFAVEKTAFGALFPNAQDMEFKEDLIHCIGNKIYQNLMVKVKSKQVLKPAVRDIHGTLYIGNDYLEGLKKYHSTKQSDVELSLKDINHS